MFNNKHVSDTSGFKKLQKYATFRPDSQSFWRCRRLMEKSFIYYVVWLFLTYIFFNGNVVSALRVGDA